MNKVSCARHPFAGQHSPYPCSPDAVGASGEFRSWFDMKIRSLIPVAAAAMMVAAPAMAATTAHKAKPAKVAKAPKPARVAKAK
jgi:hypothetical protein